MPRGVVILECPRTPQSEVWARSYGVLSGALPRDSAQLRECYGEGQHSPRSDARSPEAWEGRNSVNTYSNGASEESIGIYAKSRCQRSGCLIDLEPEPQRYGRLKPSSPLGLRQWLRHQGGRVVFQKKSVSWKSHRATA